MPEHVFVSSTPEEDRELDRLAELSERDRDEVHPAAQAAHDQLKALGAVLRAAREEEGLTLEQLAAHCGIDKTALSRIENGRANITFETLRRFAEGLGREVSIRLLEPSTT